MLELSLGVGFHEQIGFVIILAVCVHHAETEM